MALLAKKLIELNLLKPFSYQLKKCYENNNLNKNKINRISQIRNSYIPKMMNLFKI